MTAVRFILILLLMPAWFAPAAWSADAPAPKETKQTSRFTENANGTVLDTETGLMWLIDANVNKLPLPLNAAEQYIQNMNRGVVPNAGHANWRLPTMNDMETLIDKSRSYPALLRNHPFKNVQSDLYWSSSKDRDMAEYVWTLDMATGNRIADHLSSCNFRYLWPVRNTWKLSATEQGTLFTSGINKFGQLADGSGNDHASFAPVLQPGKMIKIAAGLQHALALTADGTVWVWGNNHDLQTAGSIMEREIRKPVPMEGLRTVVDIAAGANHSMALKADGTVWVWGQNDRGQLGLGSAGSSRVPVRIRELTGVVRIAAGMNHSFAVKSDGTVWAWGDNLTGQLGVGDVPFSRMPVRVPSLSKITKIAAGGNHTLAIKSDGTVLAWGENKDGQLGTGSRNQPAYTPVPVKGLINVTDIAAGQDHSLALKADGTVWAWGSNQFGQLGIPSTVSTPVPLKVEGLTTKSSKIAAGAFHSLALSVDGLLSVWGENMNSVSRKNRPYLIMYVKDVFDMAAGRYYSLLLSKSAID